MAKPAKRKKKRVGIQTFAKKLRKRATPEEIALHAALRVALEPYRAGLYFQHPIGPYVADFCITCAALVVELDGNHHYTPEGVARDEVRTGYLKHMGFTVLRFPNRRVRNELLTVVREILAQCGTMKLKNEPVEVVKLPPGEAVNIRKERDKRERLEKWLRTKW